MKNQVVTTAVLMLSILSLVSGKDCFNQLSTFTPIKGLKYVLDSDQLLEVSANKEKYSCYDLADYEGEIGTQTAWMNLDVAIRTAMVREYFPMLMKDNNDLAEAFSCPDGVKNYKILDVKSCDLKDGERVKAGPFKITASTNPDGSGKGYSKVAVVVNYVCNEEARRRTVSLRFNGKSNGKCK
ncbi:hypothetical protein M9435_006561 [Picochlorum sp. BPE23]|nr:hypothetical protein M9435_006561 [Picochlorum sp. BPE23]